MEFKVLLGAITLFLAGFLLFALAFKYIDPVELVGIIFVVDGSIYAGHGLVVNADTSSKRFRMVWGSILALVGVVFLGYPTLGRFLIVIVVGVAMVLIGLFVLYGEAYGGKK
ncbi:MAG: hypothetical protein ABSG92_07185 [Conexivisphaerales archaeon]